MLIGLVSASCGLREDPAPAAAVTVGDGPTSISLYLSNQSRADSSVDAVVLLDGVEVIRQDLVRGDGHVWIAYEILVAEGSHLVEIRDGAASSPESLKVVTAANTDAYVSATYWGLPGGDSDIDAERGFILSVMDGPLEFE